MIKILNFMLCILYHIIFLKKEREEKKNPVLPSRKKILQPLGKKEYVTFLKGRMKNNKRLRLSLKWG